MQIGPAIPILRIFDETRTNEFYLDFLGFALGWNHRFAPDLPLYIEVAKGKCVLHLSEHHGDACPGSALRIPVSDVDAYCAELLAKAYRHARPAVAATPWGSRDMAITDPFGNRLIFTQADTQADSPADQADQA